MKMDTFLCNKVMYLVLILVDVISYLFKSGDMAHTNTHTRTHTHTDYTKNTKH